MSDQPTPSREAVQHGAMEASTPDFDLDRMRLYRLERVRAALKERDYAAAVLFDPLNTRYATDSTNMQLWCTHNEVRYAFVPAEGPVVLFEYGRVGDLLTAGMPTVDEIRPARSWFYFGSGPRHEEHAKLWAQEIGDLVTSHGGGNKRIALDRVNFEGIRELLEMGYSIHDGFEMMENARLIKSPDELLAMKRAITACEAGMTSMYEALRPGITENQLWAKLHETNIAHGGEWIETRLLSSGPRTNPWFRECSHRVIEDGDMVSFDTDLIGPYGYCADISRAWVAGDGKPSDEQRTIYKLAAEQIDHNMALLKAGVSYREVSEKAWPIPELYQAGRYGSLIHGIGLCDEYPSIKHHVDFDAKGYDGIFQENMTVCVESFIGAEGGREGVKLEEQVLITRDGIEQLSSYPLDEDLLA
jgi:Xaa-Pro aminopeptidase